MAVVSPATPAPTTTASTSFMPPDRTGTPHPHPHPHPHLDPNLDPDPHPDHGPLQRPRPAPRPPCSHAAPGTPIRLRPPQGYIPAHPRLPGGTPTSVADPARQAGVRGVSEHGERRGS